MNCGFDFVDPFNLSRASLHFNGTNDIWMLQSLWKPVRLCRAQFPKFSAPRHRGLEGGGNPKTETAANCSILPPAFPGYYTQIKIPHNPLPYHTLPHYTTLWSSAPTTAHGVVHNVLSTHHTFPCHIVQYPTKQHILQPNYKKPTLPGRGLLVQPPCTQLAPIYRCM